MSNKPYIKRRRVIVQVEYLYNPKFGDDRICAEPDCGHAYYRHFDPYEGHANVGCKYCGCRQFKVGKFKCE